MRDASMTLAWSPPPRRGKDLGELGMLRGGSVLTAEGKILGVGTSRHLDAEVGRLKAGVIDCRGRVVMPSFVDSHTHLVFAGIRVEDYELLLCGKAYEQIAAAGGGTQLSARPLREASKGKLAA